MSARLAGSLISGAMLGKALGFAREIEMARLLGANFIADSFRGALTAVLLPVAPVQGDMLPSVLIPLHRTWQKSGRPAQQSGAMAILLGLLAVAVAVAVYALAAPWVGLLVGGFDARAQALTIRFVRVMSLAIPGSVLAGCFSSVEIATGKSRIAAARASVQNLSMMIGIAVMAATGEALAIPWSFVISFNGIAAYGAWKLWREGEITVRGMSLRVLAGVAAAFCRRFRPLMTVPLADQGNVLLERLLASGAAVGTLASLDYARTLTESAFYLISQPIGYVVLTRAPGERHAVLADVERLSQRLLAFALPMSIFIAVFATDIVRVVFARGAFNAHAVALTAGALRGISAGLWATTLGWVLVRMVNAAGRNGRASLIIVSAYAANAVVNIALVPALGTLGLGLGEATRGVVLLAGTVQALGCGRLMLRCLARAAPVAAALAGAGAGICAMVDGPLARLAAGVPLFGVVTVLWLALHLPEQARWVVNYARRPRRVAVFGGGRD